MEDNNWTNKDWKWILGILIGFITLLLILILGKYNLEKYFSFASNMISIILAIVAIIYAFIESKKSSEYNLQQQNTLHEIDKKVLELENVVKEVELIRNNILDLKVNSEGKYNLIINSIETFKNKLDKYLSEINTQSQDNNNFNEVKEKLNSDFLIMKEQLIDALDQLTPREEKVLRLRFGLDDGRARTLEEVGKEFNLSGERIRQIEGEALQKLRSFLI